MEETEPFPQIWNRDRPENSVVQNTPSDTESEDHEDLVRSTAARRQIPKPEPITIPKPIKTLLKHTIIILSIIYILIPTIFLLFGEKILPALFYLYPLSYSKLGIKTCSITSYHPELTGENINIHQKKGGNYAIPAFWIPASKRSHIIVYAHGSGFDRCKQTRIQNYKTLNKLGYSVLAFDYGGFSNSTKSAPDADSLMHDVETVLEFAEKIRNPDPKKSNSERKIILWAHSLGTVVSTRAIKETQAGRFLDALVLEAAHADLVRVVVVDHPWPEPVRRVYGKVMVEKGVEYFKKSLKLDKFDTLVNVEAVAELSLPTIILHAEDDEEVPIAHGEDIFTRLKHRIPELHFIKSGREEKLGHYCLDKMADRWSGVLKKILDEN